jgi:hypothetical protein
MARRLDANFSFSQFGEIIGCGKRSYHTVLAMGVFSRFGVVLVMARRLDFGR